MQKASRRLADWLFEWHKKRLNIRIAILFDGEFLDVILFLHHRL